MLGRCPNGNGLRSIGNCYRQYASEQQHGSGDHSDYGPGRNPAFDLLVTTAQANLPAPYLPYSYKMARQNWCIHYQRNSEPIETSNSRAGRYSRKLPLATTLASNMAKLLISLAVNYLVTSRSSPTPKTRPFL